MIRKENFDLTNYNSYRVKSTCKVAYFPECEEDFLNLYSSNKKYILLGSGHNVILSKEYYEDEFIILNGNFNSVEINDLEGIISAESGVTMLELSKIAYKFSLSGIEIFYDIPSSLGGAVVMNAGASGEEIKDVLTKVRYLDLQDLTIKEIQKEESYFEYRNSIFQKNQDKIILKAWLQLKKSNPIDIFAKMENIKELRWLKQPKEFPNAGSVFKRPNGYYVGALMDELNLKGMRVGGAMVSEKHGGFIVNWNNATGKNILDLIEYINHKVFEKYGFNLEIEQRII